MVGSVFFIEGLVLIVYSSKTDQIYDSKMFDWGDDDEFFSFVEYMGFAGVASALTGILYGLGENQTELALFITTALLTGLAITGFDSKHSHVRWRRALGVYGSMITLIILYNEINDPIFGPLTIVLMGLLALGYAFIYQQRRHTFDVRDTEEVHELNAWIEEAVVTPTKGLMAKVEADDESEVVEVIETVEEAAEEIEEDAEEVVEKIAKAVPVPKPVKAAPKRTPMRTPMRKNEGYIETLQSFDVRMPPQAIEQIKRTIEMTPHEGFNPVVRVNSIGQIVLDFEPK
jgi:predicted RNase H-like HicB family nuclease